MKGDVSKIRNNLLQIVTFLTKDMTAKTPVPNRQVHYYIDN